MKKIFAIVFSFICLCIKGDVLLWTIDDTSIVDGNSIISFISPLPDDDDNWAVGRVKITTGSGEVIYPILASPNGDPNISPDYYPGNEGIWIGGGGDFWGAEWNQSILPANVDEATALIAIELGINHYNSDTDEIDFELLAYTDPETYENLQAFMYQLQDLNPLTATPWTPTVYHTIPEPSTGMMSIIGLSFLLLRRKCFN